MDDFILRALLSGLAIAVLAGPVGAVLVWRHMSFFGGALSHAALLGVAAGLWIGISPQWGVAAVGVLISVLLVLMRQQGQTSDSLLAIWSHASLAAGVVWLSFSAGPSIDWSSYLFGDILAVGPTELITALLLAPLGLLLLWRLWDALLLITLNEALAQVEGVATLRLNLVFMSLVAVLVALSVHLVGVLLVTSLLVIPAVTVRGFCRSPEQMAVAAGLMGCVAVVQGIAMSWWWDWPTGPAIVLASTSWFVVSQLVGSRWKWL